MGAACHGQGGRWPASSQAPLHSSVHTYNLWVCQSALLQVPLLARLELWSKRSGSCPESFKSLFKTWFRLLSYTGSSENSFSLLLSSNCKEYGLICWLFPYLMPRKGKNRKKKSCVSSRGQVRRSKPPPKLKKCYQNSTVWKLPLLVHWRDWSEPSEFCYMCSCMKHCEKQCKKCKCRGFLSVFNL